jgi:hypothetical protein
VVYQLRRAGVVLVAGLKEARMSGVVPFWLSATVGNLTV